MRSRLRCASGGCFGLMATLALILMSQQATAASAPRSQPTPVDAGSPGMVVRGDQEAPLVLYIFPWQEANLPSLAPAPSQLGLPQVLDRFEPLERDPMNQPLPAQSPFSQPSAR